MRAEKIAALTEREALVAYVHRQACSLPDMPHANPSNAKCGDIVDTILAARPAPEPLDPRLVPLPLPEMDCLCLACVYLRRKQTEAYARRLAPGESQP